VLRSHAVTALARLDQVALLPELLALHADDRTDALVRQSLAIAFGRLGSLEQPSLIEHLLEDFGQAGDVAARQFTLLSLARIAARSEPDHPGRGPIERLLRRQIADPDRRIDRPWAALAAGLYVRDQAEPAPALLDALARRYREESDPSVKAAFAIALGLSGARQHANRILQDVQRSQDDAFRGYAAIGLGLLRHRDAAPLLLEISVDETISHSLRLQVVRALGLMRERELTDELVGALREADTLQVAWSLGRALGQQRDPRASEPLSALARDVDRSVYARAFACVALGLVGDKAERRFNTPLRLDMPYLARAYVLEEVAGL
jgi:HEAT repeat protein